VSQTSHTAAFLLTRQPFDFWSRSGRNEGHLLLRPKQSLLCIWPQITAGDSKHHTWHSFPIRHNLCKFGRNRSVKNCTLLVRAKEIFHPYVALHFSGLTQTSHMPLPPHAPQSVPFWLKSACNKGHFTLDGENVFRACRASYWCGVNQTSHAANNCHVSQPVQVWSKSVCKEGHPVAPRIAAGCLKSSRALFTLNTPQPVQVWLKSSCNKWHFLLRPKQFFIPISPRIAAGCLKYP
jgi:hypothetical protein